MNSNRRPAPDQVLVDIADYVIDYQVASRGTLDAARLCLTDTLACAFDALDFEECRKMLGPIVPGIVVAHGARVPGTRFELDPATAAFSLGCMIRWLDLNDTFSGAQGSHPSDNLAGILMLADYLSRRRLAAGDAPLLMAEVLSALVKAYEIQGGIAIENDLTEGATGVDQAVLTRVASAAVLTRMLGGTREQVISAISNAWIDGSLAVYRRSPNTGPRKNWASADASLQAVRLAFMAIRNEMGYPSVLSARQYGYYDARFGGRPFRFQRPYGEYIIHNSMFKCVAGGMLSQSAVECAFELRPLVLPRLDQIERIDIRTQRALMSAMNKTGPLHNAADRDHCVQYVVAVALLYGQINPRDFEDDFAQDPRIDALRERMVVTEDERFTREFHEPDKRSSANALQVHFTDGSQTPLVSVDYPAGHPRRRAEVAAALQAKLEGSVRRRFPPPQCDRILAACADAGALAGTPVSSLVDQLVL